MSRTFTPPTTRAPAAVAGDAFELTRADFFDLFTFGYEFHLGLSPDEGAYPFDVGATDDPSPKAWTVPDADLVTTVWIIADPATTPYAASFPDATHALVTSSEPGFEGTLYNYYRFEDDRFVSDGDVEAPADGSAPEIDQSDSVMGVFPLNMAMDLFRTGFATLDDDEDFDPERAYPVTSHVGAHGIGVITRPDGTTVEAGAFFDDYVVYDPDDPDGQEVLDWDTYYSILGTDGTWLFARVADPPGSEEGDDVPIEGEIYIDEVEYIRIVAPPATAGERGPDGGAAWSLYPNPTADRVRFSETLTATVYDVMGRAVRQADQAREVDLRGLAAGTYVVRAATGQSRTVTVRR